MISLLLVNNFYIVISYQRVEKEKKATNYCTRSLVMVRNQLPAQVVENFFLQNSNIFSVLSIFKYNSAK